MSDLRHPGWMYLKGALFVGIGLISCALILLECPRWKVAVLLALAIWAFARAYYFAFYVIEHYIDPSYRFAGLWSFLCYVAGSKSSQKRTSDRNERSDV